MNRAVLGMFLSACLNAQPASLEGTAIHAITKEPLSGVHIRLVAVIHDRPALVYGALSDRAGHFSIAGMQPGTYRLIPERAGLVYAPAKRAVPVVSLKPGQQITDFKFEMAPLAAIAGRVVDEYGDPVPNVPVQMVSTDPPIEQVPFAPASTSTNDRGEFRLARAPGKYHVVAMPYDIPGANEVPEVRSDGTSEPVHGTTYYPSVARKDRAVAVEAEAGREVTGIEIRLVRKRSLSIGGVVKSPDGNVVASITMQHGENSQNISMSTGMGTGPDGKFLLTRLEPGFYRLYADHASGGTRLQSQVVEVQLDAADVTNLELVLALGGDLTGLLEIAGAPAEKGIVRLEAVELNTFGRQISSGVDQTGAFRFSGIPPGKYRVHVEPLPENAYIATVQLDGSAPPDRVLDFSRGARGSTMKISVRLNGGELSGRIVDSEGEPLANPLAEVFLVEDASAVRWEKLVNADPDGKYSFKGVRPGKYRLFAIDTLGYVGGRGQAALKKLAAGAESIEIKENDRITKDLKLTSTESADAK